MTDVEDCAYAWSLLDPNEEDVRFGSAHRCRFTAGHDNGHQCACGSRPEDDVL